MRCSKVENCDPYLGQKQSPNLHSYRFHLCIPKHGKPRFGRRIEFRTEANWLVLTICTVTLVLEYGNLSVLDFLAPAGKASIMSVVWYPSRKLLA